MKLIDKDALVAEIIHKIKVLEAFIKNFDGISDKVEKAKNKIEALGDALLFIENLEVKEVDLDFMLHEYWNISPKICVDCLESATMTKDEMIKFAKHFFELGLKASNPLTWEDIEMIGKLRLKVALDLRNKELESSINNPIKFTEEDFCKEVLKRFKAQKGE